MSVGQYDPKISVSKGNTAATNVAIGGLPLAVLIGFLRGSWPNLLPWPIEMDAGAITIIAAMFAWVQAWRENRAKHAGNVAPPPTPPGPVIPPLPPATVGLLVIGLAFAVALGGCTTATTRFSETVIDADGSTATTEYRASSTAAPLGKLDTTGHTWGYRWGGDNEITTGQQAAGMDNQGQAVVIPLIQSLVDGLLKAITQLQAQAVENAATAPTGTNSATVGAGNLAPVP